MPLLLCNFNIYIVTMVAHFGWYSMNEILFIVHFFYTRLTLVSLILSSKLLRKRKKTNSQMRSIEGYFNTDALIFRHLEDLISIPISRLIRKKNKYDLRCEMRPRPIKPFRTIRISYFPTTKKKFRLCRVVLSRQQILPLYILF